MKTAIMQPYFFPYIGYFQLINAADKFIVYDNIQYTKKGWINRNRYLQNGKDEIFSISLKKETGYKNVIDRMISPLFNKKKLIAKFQNAYSKAPYKKEVLPFLEDIIYFEDINLFNYIYNSILKTCDYLDIKTEIIISSSINIDHSLKSKSKVTALIKALKADIYINPIGGIKLYDKEEFKNNNIELYFLKTNETPYNQNMESFVPLLSIIDVLMYNSKHEVKKMLDNYTLI